MTAELNAALLQCTWDEFQYHLDMSHITKGAHTEHPQTKFNVFLYIYQLV